MYLLDTNAASDLRKPPADRQVKHAAGSMAASVYPFSSSVCSNWSPVYGRFNAKMPNQGAVWRGWLDAHGTPAFADRVLAVDTVLQRGAGLHDPHKMASGEVWIAAAAWVHGLTVITRNMLDVDNAGVASFDPWMDRF
jgi:predicted nucleic acid-binding protein